MNYSEIKTAVLAYADRYDIEVDTHYASWLPIVEGRINSEIASRLSLVDLVIPITSTDKEFAFPDDLLFLKQVSYVKDNGVPIILPYVVEYFVDALISDGVSKNYYTVTSNALKIAINLANDSTEELILKYEQKVPALDDTVNTTNWLAANYPNVYIFGLLVEAYAFVKDAEAAQLWDARFKESLSLINSEDYRHKWSGKTLLQTALG